MKKEKRARPFRIIKTGLHIPKEKLYRNIDIRTDGMIAKGLEDEVNLLLPHRGLNALRTLGYNEMFQYLDGSYSIDECVRLIKINTRHYAKRQLTWFRKDTQIKWIEEFNISSFEKMLS